MQNKLKVGIVGCGGIVQQQHIPAFFRLDNLFLQATCDKNRELAQQTAVKYHIPKTYTSLSDMLSEEKLNIVDICTPPQTHAPLALEAIRQGCNVLIEKPMALNTSDCEEMISASARNRVKLCVIHNQLFTPPFLEAKKLAAKSTFGDFIGMRIFLSDPREEMIMRKDYWIHKLPGGLIGETGPHVAYMSLAFLKRVTGVEIYAKNFLEHPWSPFDEFRIELEGEKAMSSITVSYASNRHESVIDIMGTEGILHLDLSKMVLTHYGRKVSSRPLPVIRHLFKVSCQVLGGVAVNAFKLTTGTLKLGHDIIIERFVDCILNDTQPPITGEEGKKVVEVMEMIVARLQEKYRLN